MKWTLFGAAVLVSLVVIAKLAPESSVQQADFFSMQTCLAGIKQASGMTLTIDRDKPDIVSGRLTDGRNFACARRETGTKGVYVDGWFDSK